MSVASIAADATVGGVYAAFNLALARYRLFDVSWSWASFIGAFLLADLAFYCWHRANHRER